MSSITRVRGLTSKNVRAILISVVTAAAFGTLALAAQDKYTLQVPNGLTFAEFRGYENWRDVAVS
jgi:hypothetical protein